MVNGNNSEKEIWNNVKQLLGNREIKLGQHWSYNLHNDPKRLVFVLSRYKFAAKMGSSGRRILELGCSEGIGAPILSEFAIDYTGIDLDRDAIEAARRNWASDKRVFIEDNFLGKTYGIFDTVVSLDVVEHIIPEKEDLFFHTIYENLHNEGMAIVGTPNLTAEIYASSASKAGHVNLFDGERLKAAILKIFQNVFIFGLNDEVVHTGFTPMAHYLVCLGCHRKPRRSL